MSDQTTAQLNKIRKQAEQLDKLGHELCSQIKKNPMLLSRKVLLPIKTLELYKYMKSTYTSFDEWRADVGLGRSTAFDWVKTAEALEDIDDKDYYAMPMGNARLLAKLAPKQRTESMIRKAQEMTEEDFLLAVNKVKKDNGEQELDSRVTFKIRCYEGQREIYEEAIKKFAEVHKLEPTDIPRILELMCAEILSGIGEGKAIIVNLQQAVLNGAFHLKQANALFGKDSGRSADETLDLVHKIIEEAANALAAATKGFVNPKPQPAAPKQKEAKPGPVAVPAAAGATVN